MVSVMQFSWDNLILKARFPVLAVAALAVALFAYKYLPLPENPPPPEQAPVPEWSAPLEFEPAAWKVFKSLEGGATAAAGSLGQRFRLAGTFSVFAENTDKNQRAILDDFAKKTQHLVGEGDAIDDVTVASIFNDHVVLRAGETEETLWLSFQGSGESSPATGQPVTAAAPEEKVFEENKFGKRVGEKRWVLSKQALLEYYQEILDDPERITNLYASLRPDYSKEGQILGYVYDPQGEREFFKAMGIQEGDTIRKVNSMIMKSQSRAEYMLGEFIQNRLNTVVIDYERNGTADKMIYLIR